MQQATVAQYCIFRTNRIYFLIDLLINSINYLTYTYTRLIRNLTQPRRNRHPHILRHLSNRYNYYIFKRYLVKLIYIIGELTLPL